MQSMLQKVHNKSPQVESRQLIGQPTKYTWHIFILFNFFLFFSFYSEYHSKPFKMRSQA